jgi:hypothetical protein
MLSLYIATIQLVIYCRQFYYASISTLPLQSYTFVKSSFIFLLSLSILFITSNIIVILRLLRRRDAACRERVVVDREARRLRSYRPLDEGIHEEAEGKWKL